jgi:hypothetical protein
VQEMTAEMHLPPDLVTCHMPELAAADINTATPLAQVQLLLLPPTAAAKATPDSSAAACIELEAGVVVTKLQDDTAAGQFEYVLSGQPLTESAPASTGWYLRRKSALFVLWFLS